MSGTDIRQVLAERGEQYGLFRSHAEIAQLLKDAMRSYGADDLEPDMREALEMIQHKIARILNGSPNHVDSWRDIAGYAILVADRLEQ